jgi:nucleoside-diphosphate-sugar epimerase
MTVLITGGAGFVGLNIAQQVLAQGRNVVSYGLEAPPERALRALGELPGRIHVCIGDIRDREDLLAVMREHQVERVVHGAAVTAAAPREATQASLIMAVNLGGTIELLEAAITHGVTRVVQLGSGSVYGSAVKADGHLVEDIDVPVPDSLYGISKYAAERTALRFRATRGLDVAVARLGVVFGRWEYDTGVRDTLSVPLTLAGIARSRAHAAIVENVPDDWVYAIDVAAAVVGLLDAPSLHHSLYHVASGRRWSVPDWCEMLKEAFPGFSYEFVADPARANVGKLAPLRRPPFSIARLQAEQDFKVRYGPQGAFADYLAWQAGAEAQASS